MTEPATRPEPNRSPLWQLTLARIRLFYREPSILFWTFLFPILLTVALGIAFRSRPPEPIRVGVVAGPAAETTRAALAVRADVEATVLPPEAAATALRTGRVSVVVEPGVAAGPPLRPDPAGEPARAPRGGRPAGAGGGSQGSALPREETASEPGSRYVDFLIPGLLGMNVMSTGLWGIGYVIVENRQKKLLKRLAATPMRRIALPPVLRHRTEPLPRAGGPLPARLRRPHVRHPPAGGDRDARRRHRRRRGRLRGARPPRRGARR